MADGPALVCPGCGSRDVDVRRGLLCGTCAETVEDDQRGGSYDVWGLDFGVEGGKA
jgi:DNA-directed RNA polymerase subunit RPC12/RpoP